MTHAGQSHFHPEHILGQSDTECGCVLSENDVEDFLPALQPPHYQHGAGWLKRDEVSVQTKDFVTIPLLGMSQTLPYTLPPCSRGNSLLFPQFP